MRKRVNFSGYAVSPRRKSGQKCLGLFAVWLRMCWFGGNPRMFSLSPFWVHNGALMPRHDGKSRRRRFISPVIESREIRRHPRAGTNILPATSRRPCPCRFLSNGPRTSRARLSSTSLRRTRFQSSVIALGTQQPFLSCDCRFLFLPSSCCVEPSQKYLEELPSYRPARGETQEDYSRLVRRKIRIVRTRLRVTDQRRGIRV
jgi:hypothetical protein